MAPPPTDVPDTFDQPGIFRYVLDHHKARTAFMVLLLGLAGILEGLGVAVVLPILESILSTGGGEPSGLARAVTAALALVGLEPSLGILLTGLVVAFTLKGAFLYGAFLQVGIVIARMTMELRLRLLRAIIGARWGHILQYPSGFVANALSAESMRSAGAYMALNQALAEGAAVLAYLGVAFAIDWKAASASLVAGLAIILALQGRVNASRRAGQDQVKLLRGILARLTDALPSLKPLKAMGMEEYLLPRLDEATRSFFAAQKREIASTELIKKTREPVLILVLAVGFWAVLSFTTMNTTSLMVLALLFYRTSTSITNMQHYWVTVRVGESSFQSLMEHIQSAELARERLEESGTEPAPAFDRELRLEDVRFAYEDHSVLEGVDGVLSAGTFVALVGPSGSGKTTLTDLITGLLRPDSGRILVDGVDLSRVRLKDWRHRIGYVPQEPMLFSDTVRQNLTLGMAGIDDDRVEQALRSASAWDFVSALPGGLDHRIGEGGTTLSGGQRQRLAIARALVTDTRLMILDEPTTALDARSEADVLEAVSALRGAVTILAISHQPAIRDLADEVWELTDGRLDVREGSRARATPAP